MPVVSRYAKLRWRRRIRTRKKRVVEISGQANESVDRYLLRRWQSLADVRRFVSVWLTLLVLAASTLVVQTRALGGYYLTDGPIGGGVYVEGLVGRFSNANPIYAVSQADASVSKLLFSSLLSYNDANQLVGDLAESYQSNDRANVYTVVLREGLQWHDGHPLTSTDVVYTYNMIKNPDALSPLNQSWNGVTVRALDARTIQFELPIGLVSFPHSLTTGILPQHILEGIPASQLRSSRFNTSSPIGSGPFRLVSIDNKGTTAERLEQRIELTANAAYHHGKPHLDGVTLRIFADDDHMLSAFRSRELTAILSDKQLPSDLSLAQGLQSLQLSVSGSVMLFLRSSSPILADKNVRTALTQATNTAAIRESLGYPTIAVNSPLLRNHIGYNTGLTQQPFDLAAANTLLDQAGWIMDPVTGYRARDGVQLSINLTSQSRDEYSRIASILQQQWKAIGVKLNPDLRSLDEFEQSFIIPHNYDVLLYGISVGPDPDVFPFWHSSQAVIGGLNLAEFKSGAADAALEAGRSRAEASLRAAKYKPLLESWRAEAPAIGLYQPVVFYTTRGTVYGQQHEQINAAADRFNGVHLWMINQEKVLRTAE